MEPVTMEPIAVPGRISGSGIIHDLLSRVHDKLACNCDLREIDAYSGYVAKVQIEIQLLDVYPVTVAAEVVVGKIDPQQPSLHINLGSEVTAEVDEPSLERPVDPDGVVAETPAVAAKPERRYYTPRNVVPGSRRQG